METYKEINSGDIIEFEYLNTVDETIAPRISLIEERITSLEHTVETLNSALTKNVEIKRKKYLGKLRMFFSKSFIPLSIFKVFYSQEFEFLDNIVNNNREFKDSGIIEQELVDILLNLLKNGDFNVGKYIVLNEAFINVHNENMNYVNTLR